MTNLTLEDEVGSDLDLPQVVCEYEAFFRMSYWDYFHRGM